MEHNERHLLEDVLHELKELRTDMSALSDAVAAVQTDQQSLDAAVQALTNAVQNDEQASDAAAAVTALQAVSTDLQAQAEAVNTATAQLAGTPSTPPASSEAPATPA